MLSPLGRMSPFQQAQMFSLQDAEHPQHRRSTACSTTARTWSRRSRPTSPSSSAHSIGTVNSINWARLLAQVVYYFAGWFQATERDDERGRLRRADRQLRQHLRRPRRAQRWACRSAAWCSRPTRTTSSTSSSAPAATACAAAAETHETSSPSMDISKASNFERFVFDALGRDPARTRALFAEVETRRAFALDAGRARALRAFGFVERPQHRAPTGWRRSADVHAALRRGDRPAHRRRAQGRARASPMPATPMIVLETALAAKFNATIRAAIGSDAPRPARLAGLEALPRAVRDDAGRRRAPEGVHRRK